MTTIKTLKDGRTLTTDGTRLYVDGSDVGAAQAHSMAPQGAVVAYAKTTAGNIGLTRSDIEAINHAASPVVGEDPSHKSARTEQDRKARAWDREHNEGGQGYNPFRRADVEATIPGDPDYKSDL